MKQPQKNTNGISDQVPESVQANQRKGLPWFYDLTKRPLISWETYIYSGCGGVFSPLNNLYFMSLETSLAARINDEFLCENI